MCVCVYVLAHMYVYMQLHIFTLTFKIYLSKIMSSYQHLQFQSNIPGSFLASFFITLASPFTHFHFFAQQWELCP